MQVGILTRILVAASLIGLSSIGFVGGAGAQDDESDESEGVDEEGQGTLAEDLEAELIALLQENGIDVGTEGLGALIGEPGDLDLPPGEIILPAIIEEYETTEIPDGGGSSLTGPCLGVAFSFDGDGGALDAAADFSPALPPYDLYGGGQAFTAANPFEVDVNGFVVYAGYAPTAPTNHVWYVEVQGLNLDAGGDDNEGLEQNNAGSVDLAGQLPAPAKVNALFKIDGSMTADGGFNCAGSGYFRTTGGMPILEVGGILLLGAGALGAIFNARPARTW